MLENALTIPAAPSFVGNSASIIGVSMGPSIADDRLTAVNDHDVLAARVAQATDEPRHLAILVGFFGQHFYAVEVVPADQPGRAVGAPRPMPWYPAPRA